MCVRERHPLFPGIGRVRCQPEARVPWSLARWQLAALRRGLLAIAAVSPHCGLQQSDLRNGCTLCLSCQLEPVRCNSVSGVACILALLMLTRS